MCFDTDEKMVGHSLGAYWDEATQSYGYGKGEQECGAADYSWIPFTCGDVEDYNNAECSAGDFYHDYEGPEGGRCCEGHGSTSSGGRWGCRLLIFVAKRIANCTRQKANFFILQRITADLILVSHERLTELSHHIDTTNL